MKPLFQLFFSLCFLLLNGYSIQAEQGSMKGTSQSVPEYFAKGAHHDLLFSKNLEHRFSAAHPEAKDEIIYAEENDNDTVEPFLLKKSFEPQSYFTSSYRQQAAYYSYCVRTRLPLFQFIYYTQPEKCISFQVFRV